MGTPSRLRTPRYQPAGRQSLLSGSVGRRPPFRNRRGSRITAQTKYVQYVPRWYRKRSRVDRRGVEVFTHDLDKITFDGKGDVRVLNAIKLGNSKHERQSDKIVVKGIRLLGNVVLGPTARSEAEMHHVVLLIVADDKVGDSSPNEDDIFSSIGPASPETWTVRRDMDDRFRIIRRMKLSLEGGANASHAKRHIELVDKWIDTNIWTDYRDALFGPADGIARGALYLVAAVVNGSPCHYTLRVEIRFRNCYLL